MATFFNFILAHSGDAADPELLHWIKERLDQLFGSSPWVLVIVMGAIIFAIPIFVIVVYLMQGGRRADTDRPSLNNQARQGCDSR
jgi:F0F1-type ATP synthase assembly protein I